MDISYREIYAMNKEEAKKHVVNTYLILGNCSTRSPRHSLTVLPLTSTDAWLFV